MKTFVSNNPAQTKRFAEKKAKELLRRGPRKRAVVLGLIGDLGSGKTTFAQGFGKGLGIKGKIKSPTFILMRRHKNFYHFDAYRVDKPKEILSLGWKKIINNPQNIVLTEWAEKIIKILPRNFIKIKFKHDGKNKRKIIIGNV